MKINRTGSIALFMLGLIQILLICHVRFAILSLWEVNAGIITAMLMIVASREWLAISASCLFFAILNSQKYRSDTFLPIMSDITVMTPNEHLVWIVAAVITALIAVIQARRR